MLKKTLLFAFTFILSTTFSQGINIDSVLNILKKNTLTDSIRIESLLVVTKYYHTRDLNKSLSFITEALEIAKKNNYKRTEGIINRQISQNYRKKGLLDKALEHALISVTILDSFGNKEDQLLTNSALSIIHKEAGYPKKGLEINLINIELIKNDPATGAKARYYYDVGNVYKALKKYKKAEVHYLEAIEISKESNFKPGEMIMVATLGELHKINGEYEKARKNFLEVLPYFEEKGQLANIAGVYNSLGTLSSLENKHAIAIPLYNKSLEIYNQVGSLPFIQKISQKLYIAHNIVGNYAEAQVANKTYNDIKDSIQSLERKQLIADMKTKYETEKKEAEILSLSQQASIQTLEIDRKNQTIIIGLVIVLFVLSVIYFISRQKSLKNQQSQTELEQRFLRSQLNPHFISNALLAVQNFMLKNQADKAALYLAKFSKLMREILENSRQEFILVEDEIEMLTNYMDIHKLRMNDAFDYKIMMDESIDPESDTIPPMFVQPFVENAIEHGVVNAKNGGLIELNFVKNGDYISIEIKDNGEGLNKSQVTESHTSLSTTIIRERMELFNKSLKNKIQLLLGDYSNDQGEILGTKVELKVPFSYL